MKTQTALYTWTAPDGTPRYLIDPAKWQDGQAWYDRPNVRSFSQTTPHEPFGPVWVRELLPIPDPLPEVHWIDVRPIAMLHGLPGGSTYQVIVDGVRHRRRRPYPHIGNFPVIVVAWPDGSKPVPPTDEPEMHYADHGVAGGFPHRADLCTTPPTVDGAR